MQFDALVTDRPPGSEAGTHVWMTEKLSQDQRYARAAASCPPLDKLMDPNMVDACQKMAELNGVRPWSPLRYRSSQDVAIYRLQRAYDSSLPQHLIVPFVCATGSVTYASSFTIASHCSMQLHPKRAAPGTTGRP